MSFTPGVKELWSDGCGESDEVWLLRQGIWLHSQLEIRSVERSICPIASPQRPNCSYNIE